MKKELFLTFAATFLAIAIAFAIVRLFAPWLLPVAGDLRVVQEDRAVAPYYENIFLRPAEETGPDHYVILDPVLKHRAPSLYPDRMGIGPNDLLGFRNRAVPNVADVVAIGGSTTYGNNAVLEQNWPSQMQRLLKRERTIVYNMSTGGWGPVQYLAAVDYALRLHPKLIIVAFNGANDSLNAVIVARNVARWKFLLDGIDYAALETKRGMHQDSRVPDKVIWKVKLKSGRDQEFIPGQRLISNRHSNASAILGYHLMGKIGALMLDKAQKAGVKLVFTVIPTKELAFRNRLTKEGIALDGDYRELVADEASNIEELKNVLTAAGGDYADVVAPLQKAAETSDNLFPFNESHPFAEGYGVIAAAIAEKVNRYLPARPRGFVAVSPVKDYPFDEVYKGVSGSAHLVATERGRLAIYFIDAEGAWLVRDPEAVPELDAGKLPLVSLDEIATLPMRGFLSRPYSRYIPNAKNN
jgi:lysophospholipase L1-like esterase